LTQQLDKKRFTCSIRANANGSFFVGGWQFFASLVGAA
jgi:hypothetical protein